MVVLRSAAAPAGSVLLLPHHQQQQQPSAAAAAAWRFDLPAVSIVPSSNSSSSSDGQQQQQPAAPAALQFELGSQMEDSLLEGMRQFEAGVDRAFGAFTQGMHMIDAAQASSEQVRRSNAPARGESE